MREREREGRSREEESQGSQKGFLCYSRVSVNPVMTMARSLQICHTDSLRRAGESCKASG